jgi:hypothetical protein
MIAASAGVVREEDRVASSGSSSSSSKDTGSPAGGRVEGVGDLVRESVRAHGRALELTQGWSEDVLGTLKDQAASYGTMLRSVDASLRAMERAVTSQAESTKALAESLKSSREVVDSAMAAHRQGVERVETYVGGLLEVLTGQLQALRGQVELGQDMLSDPVGASGAMFLKVTQDWTEAYQRLFAAATPGAPRPRDEA